jgi:hypothetical protein
MNKYILELHWLNVRYTEDENKVVIYLDGAYFSGPVLRMAAKINNNDSIRLDFTEQYVILLKNYHIAILNWGEVVYAGNIVYLKDASIHVSKLSNIPKFLSDDFLVIDTLLHEEDTHNNYLNYNTKTFSPLRENYVFSG